MQNKSVIPRVGAECHDIARVRGQFFYIPVSLGHKMSSVDHLHLEAKMLKVREHSELLSAQYLARCLEAGNVCHFIITRETPKRWMKETLFTRHRNIVEPMMLANNRKATLQAIHSDVVNKAVKDQKMKYSVRWSSTPNQ